jgi:hypothetical protein
VVRRTKTASDSGWSNSSAKGLPLLELAGVCTFETATYKYNEYSVLVTSLPYEAASISQLYRKGPTPKPLCLFAPLAFLG